MENSIEAPQNIKNRTTIWSSNLTLGYIGLKRYLHFHVHCNIIHNSQDMKTAEVSIKEWVDKEDMVYTHTDTHTYTEEYYSTLRKKEILPLETTWMDLEGIMLSEMSQRKTKTVWFHLYTESKNKPSSDRENRPVVARGEK